MFYLRETKIDAGCWLVQIGQCRIVVSVWSDWTKIVGEIWLARIFSLIVVGQIASIARHCQHCQALPKLSKKQLLTSQIIFNRKARACNN